MKTGYDIVEAFENQDGYISLEDLIDQAILEIRKEQDKLTRHAIAENLTLKALPLEEIDDHRGPFLRSQLAHGIAMNTRAF